VGFILDLLVTSVLVLLVAQVVRGIEVQSWGNALMAALVLAIVNVVIRPVALFFSLPLTILTLGLFVWLINALMFWIAGAFTPGFNVRGFRAAFLGSLLLTGLQFVVHLVI
jgi:putative membrane protein